MFEYCISLIWGMAIGLAVAVPVGPIGLICIQRTLAKNRTSGLVSGLGAATADATLATVAAFSITFVFSFITHHQTFLRIIGGFLLLFLGIIALISKKKEKEMKVDTALGHIEEYLSGLVITITNPLTTIIFFATFAGVSSKVGNGVDIATVFVIGIFLGSCLWWFILTIITDLIAHKIQPEHIKAINKWFAVIIIVAGCLILLSILFKQIHIV